MKYYLIIILFFTTCFCHAQQFGCFKTAPDNTLELSADSNIRFSNYDAFFLGEFHGVYGVSEVKFALLKYLNKNCGVTDVFMEIGLSAAYLYN